MRIRDYFYNEYEKTRTETEWNEVAKREKEILKLYKDNEKLFKEWAKKEGIDLKAKSPYTDCLDITGWVWSFAIKGKTVKIHRLPNKKSSENLKKSLDK